MLKKALELYKGMSNKVKYKKHKILDLDLANMLVDQGLQYAINKLQ